MSILIIGAGCTGAATALKLREELGSDVSISVWEKARGAGGRYTTSRDTYPNGLPADLGAQYASVDPKDENSMALMEAIVAEGGAALMPEACVVDSAERPPGTIQYAGKSGQNMIVKAMLSLSKADVTYERRVSKIDKKGAAWTVMAYDGATQQFGCVILCVPGCGPGGDNLNKIHGNWERHLSVAQWKDVEVPHDCRYSLALWLKPGNGDNLARFFDDAHEKMTNGTNTELLIWQSRKNGDPLEGPQVIVAHTPQGASGHKNQAEPRMTGEILKLLKIDRNAVSSSKIITWFQSQVLSKTSHTPCIVACDSPLLVLAGDYLTSSTFTGCVRSATAAAAETAKFIKKGGSSVQAAATSRPLTSASNSGARTYPNTTKVAEYAGSAKVDVDKSDGKEYSAWEDPYDSPKGKGKSKGKSKGKTKGKYYGKNPVAGG